MKNRVRLAILILIAVLCVSSLFSQKALKREFRGAWIATVTNIDWPTRGEDPAYQRLQLVNMLNGLYDAGVNAVIFQIRTECDALYKSPYEPWSYWLTGAQGTAPSDNFDPLQFAIEEAHKRGMEIHAWFNPYRAERTVGNYPLHTSHVVRSNPDWILTVGSYKFLNPGLQVVRDHVSKVIADVVRRYDIEGAHMDDYFYQEGIANEDAATFQAYPRGFTNLGDWRRDNVNLLIKQVYDSIKAIKPHVKWGMSPRGIWKNGVPNGISGADNYSVIYCDAVAWLSGKYIDYLAPQLYWSFGGGQDYAALQQWWSTQTNGRHLYTGNATYRIGTAFGGASELMNQLLYNRTNQNVQGCIQYSATYIIKNTGGITDILKSQTFRSPSIIPVMTWKETVAPNVPGNLKAVYDPVTKLSSFQWDQPSAASDGDIASRYLVYRFISSSPQPADFENANNLISLAGQRSATPSARIDTSNVKYYYAVAAIDKNNNESVLSNIVSLQSVGSLQTPTLVSPLEGGFFARIDLLRWNKQPNATSYNVQVSTSMDFFPSSLVLNLNTTDSTYVLTGLTVQKKYHWRVVAGNQTEAGGYSAPQSFQTAWPAPPTLVYPVNKINVSRIPTFSWLNNNATSYKIRILDGTGLLFLESIVADTQWVCTKTLNPNLIYRWNVLAANQFGEGDWSSEARFMTGQGITVVEGDKVMPYEFSLAQNYPNPFNASTQIRFSIAGTALTTLKVYDILGREIATLVNQQLTPGNYLVSFGANDLPSGVYIYRLLAGGFVKSGKMNLIR
ncbi:MAG: family 10 glycosylhydrolase [bacterium]